MKRNGEKKFNFIHNSKNSSKKVGLKNFQICGNFYFLGFYKGERSDRCEVVVERSDSCEVGVERSVLVRSGCCAKCPGAKWALSEMSWCEVGVERSDRCEVGATKWALSEVSFTHLH